MKKIISTLLIAIMLICSTACIGNSGQNITLNVLNWGEYMDEEVIKMFEEEYAIKVSYQTCDSNEAMYSVISAPGSKIDIVFPSEYMVQKMQRENLLAEIDYSKIPNSKNLMSFIEEQGLDTNRAYAVPYTWGTLGILYNTGMVDENDADSWDCLFNEKYADEIYMYDSMRDSIAIALIKLGYDINTTNADEINAAANLLIEQKPLVKAYGTDDLQQSMISGSGALAVVYSGDATCCILENDALKYSIPKEGSNIWLDYTAIPASSTNKDAAYKFINFLMRLDIATMNCEYIGYSSPIEGVLEASGEEYVELNSFNPSTEEISRCKTFRDLGDAEKLYGDAWVKVKSR